jgi:hypothetical protein
MARGKSHGLGFSNGSIIDFGGGIIAYRPTGKVLPAFRVNIADITGFSSRRATRQDKRNGARVLEQVLILQGSGTELAACPVSSAAARKIESWIRQHPSFRGNVPQNGFPTPQGTVRVDIADQLSKLEELRSAGVLSQEEFNRAKAQLLS